MRVAVCPGSFDPVTNGHLDVFRRASTLADRVIVAVLINKTKSSLFTVDERIDMLREVVADLPNVEVDSFYGLLVDYCKEHGVESVRTAEGLFYRTVKQRYWTSDWEAMHKFVMEHSVPEFFEKRLNQTNVKQFLEENPDLVPKGLNVDSEYTISVRKK